MIFFFQESRLSTYASLGSSDVCLDTSLFWTHAVPCLESYSPWTVLVRPHISFLLFIFRSTGGPSLTSPKSAPPAAPWISRYRSSLFAASFTPGPGPTASCVLCWCTCHPVMLRVCLIPSSLCLSTQQGAVYLCTAANCF